MSQFAGKQSRRSIAILGHPPHPKIFVKNYISYKSIGVRSESLELVYVLERFRECAPTSVIAPEMRLLIA
jgi:hypothetical protein